MFSFLSSILLVVFKSKINCPANWNAEQRCVCAAGKYITRPPNCPDQPVSVGSLCYDCNHTQMNQSCHIQPECKSGCNQKNAVRPKCGVKGGHGHCNQDGATNPFDYAGGSSQRGALNPYCGGEGGCHQENAINPICDGKNHCFQEGSINASCYWGRCQQQGSTTPTCTGDPEADYHGNEAVFGGGCNQENSNHPQCDAGGCYQDGALDPKCPSNTWGDNQCMNPTPGNGTSVHFFGPTEITGGQSIECAGCPSGTFGSFKNEINVSSCRHCSSGTFQATEGKSSCEPCHRGTYQSKNGSTSCVRCEIGTYQNDVGITSNCKQCEAGTFQNEKAMGYCKQCLYGTYQSKKGTSLCLGCPLGKYSSKLGGTSDLQCYLCPAGTYSNEEGTRECKTCPTGTFQLDRGTDTCRSQQEYCAAFTWFRKDVGSSATVQRVATSPPFTKQQDCAAWCIQEQFVRRSDPNLACQTTIHPDQDLVSQNECFLVSGANLKYVDYADTSKTLFSFISHPGGFCYCSDFLGTKACRELSDVQSDLCTSNLGIEYCRKTCGVCCIDGILRLPSRDGKLGPCLATASPTLAPTTLAQKRLAEAKKEYQKIEVSEENADSHIVLIVGMFFVVAFVLFIAVALFAVLYRRVKLGGTDLYYDSKYVKKLCEQEGYKPVVKKSKGLQFN